MVEASSTIHLSKSANLLKCFNHPLCSVTFTSSLNRSTRRLVGSGSCRTKPAYMKRETNIQTEWYIIPKLCIERFKLIYTQPNAAQKPS